MSYPLRHISQSASVFMTIAITFERYCAVHHPINYNQVGIKVIFQTLDNTEIVNAFYSFENREYYMIIIF